MVSARTRGDLVVWILHSEPGSGTTFEPAIGHVRLIPPLEPRGEPVLIQTAHNAFTTTGLQQLLTWGGITEVMICCTVMPNPRWLVTAAIAETASMGSFTGTCAASMIAASALPWSRRRRRGRPR